MLSIMSGTSGVRFVITFRVSAHEVDVVILPSAIAIISPGG